MKDREKILRFFKATGPEAEEMAVRLLDLAESVEKGRSFAVGPFMSPYAAQVASTIAAHMKTVTARAWGGYHEAERIKIAFVRLDYEGPVDFGMSLLSVSWDGRYRLIGHRDVLGPLMGLGIERDVLGDILMQGPGAQIIVDKPMVPWLMQNFTRVAMVPVHIEEIPMEEVKPPVRKAKEIRATVASLRLDAVGAAGFGISRSKMASAINGERVQVNWQDARGPAQEVAPGDVISFRGRGRIEIKEITGKSRKGRTGVLIERYR
jgi:RNA-binding protein YlmH